MEESGLDPTPGKCSHPVHHQDVTPEQGEGREQAAARGCRTAEGCNDVERCLVFFFFIGINNSYTVTSPNTARETTGTNGDPFLQVTELRTQSDS